MNTFARSWGGAPPRCHVFHAPHAARLPRKRSGDEGTVDDWLTSGIWHVNTPSRRAKSDVLIRLARTCRSHWRGISKWSSAAVRIGKPRLLRQNSHFDDQAGAGSQNVALAVNHGTVRPMVSATLIVAQCSTEEPMQLYLTQVASSNASCRVTNSIAYSGFDA